MKRQIITNSFINRLEALAFNMKSFMRGYFGGTHKTNSYGSTVEFADFREYNLGDDIRRIDWNLYSRFEKFFIKLFTDERQMHIQIFIDCSASMAFKNSNKEEWAIQTAAAIGYLAIQNMDKVSIKLIHDDHVDDLCGVISGKSAYLRALTQLDNIEFKGTAQIDKAITKDLNPGYSDGMTVIISDFLTDVNWKNAVEFLMYRHRDVMLVQVLDPVEVSPNYKGRHILVDSEAPDRLDERNVKINITKSDYEAYLHALDDYLEDIKNFVKKRNLVYMHGISTDPVEKLFIEQLYESGVIK